MKKTKTPLEELKGNKNILKLQTEEDKIFTREIVSIQKIEDELIKKYHWDEILAGKQRTPSIKGEDIEIEIVWLPNMPK